MAQGKRIIKGFSERIRQWMSEFGWLLVPPFPENKDDRLLYRMRDEIAVDAAAEDVSYVHLLFDRHEIVAAEGAAAESLHTGPEALKALSPAARAEIAALFPDLARPPARPLVPGARARRLAARHAANRRALQAERGGRRGPAAVRPA